MKQLKRTIILCIIALTIKSCANIKPPTGGDKDIKPPYLQSIFPSDSTLNFKGYKLALTFDEFIALKNFYSEVTVNPYIDPKLIKTEIRGKKLYIDLPNDLYTNTTYHIDFGKSITDIHEYTPFDSLGYTFSTGSYIDTLKVEGTITRNGSNKLISDITIGLYPSTDTISPVQDKPKYYAKSTLNKFTIGSLPNDSYKIYAFTDKNNNLLYDSLTEEVAFLDQIIYTSQLDTIDLNLFKESTGRFNFERPTYEENFVEVKFTRGILTMDCKEDHIYLLHTNTVNIYPKENNETISFIALDSFNTRIDTTFTTFKSTAPFTDSAIAVLPIVDYKTKEPFEGIQIKSNHLFKSYLTDSITVVLNGDTSSLTLSSVNHKLIKEDNVIQFFTDNKNDTLSVNIPRGAIQYLSGHYNKVSNNIHLPIDFKKYGQITGTIETEVPNYVVLLMDMNDNVITRDKNISVINYQYVKPGKYQIKVLIDENGNGTYDTGKIQLKKQPEAYYLYKQPIDLKANWELGNINITF